ncbi:DUF2259 domain-containing protein [Roseibium limicola]|nr:DUF2259 domain-containing protein [Roseibium limicola]
MSARSITRHTATSLVWRGLGTWMIATLMTSAAALAGDVAQVNILGFSANAKRFAFEQYGIQDGSGSPYSELFVLDVSEDRWVSPSPIRERLEDVPDRPDLKALLAQTRAAVLQEARDIGLLGGIEPLGHTVGHNPVTELTSDATFMRVMPRPILPPFDAPLEFRLTSFPAPSADCASDGVETTGFTLSLTREGQTRELHSDTNIPDSRGCPLRYRIERVVTYYPEDRGDADGYFAVLVFYEARGFEGPDGRYLAITGKI